MDTGVTHAHSTGGYRERRASCELGARIMGVPALRDLSVDDLPAAQERMDDVTFRRVRHIVTENQRVLDTVHTLNESGPRAIGALLSASHASMRDDFEISVPELDTAVEAALAAGAVGARMTGGGFGGAAIALVDRAEREAVTAAVDAAFAAAGYTAPHVFPVTPSAGAARG
jgi:galactokinase